MTHHYFRTVIAYKNRSTRVPMLVFLNGWTMYPEDHARRYRGPASRAVMFATMRLS